MELFRHTSPEPSPNGQESWTGIPGPAEYENSHPKYNIGDLSNLKNFQNIIIDKPEVNMLFMKTFFKIILVILRIIRTLRIS